jgi:hypothetical protein
LASNDDLQAKLKEGVAAARRGDRTTARRLLEQVIQEDDNNEMAWIWLASSVNTLRERRACLEKVLQINPDNARAREALRELGKQQREGGHASTEETIDRLQQLRDAQSSRPRREPTPRRADSGAGLNVGYLLIGLVIVGAVLIVGLLGSQLFQPGSSSPIDNPRIVIRTPGNASSGLRPPPATANFVIIQPENRVVPTLPPTFTPTATATATVTPTATETPFPLSEFSALYVSLAPGEAQPGLYTMNADGSGGRALVGSVGDIAFNPNGQQIAFSRAVTYPPDDQNPEEITVHEIFVAPVDNPEAATQLTTLRNRSAHSPSWSPDGAQIVFVSDWDGDEDLWLIDAAGGTPLQLTLNEAIDRDPAWSPDGRQIVFASDLDTPGLTEIYSLRLDIAVAEASDAITRLTNDNGSSYAPAWSSDGSRIAFISDRFGDGDLFIMDGDGQRSVLLTEDDGGAEDRQPAFTPDGRWVGFVSNREDDAFQVYVIDLRGNTLLRLTRNGQGDLSVAFQPDIRFRLP